MKKITSDDFENMFLKGGGNSTPFYRAIVSLKPGAALMIKKNEFYLKRPPSRICRYIEKRFSFTRYLCGYFPEKDSWVVKCVK